MCTHTSNTHLCSNNLKSEFCIRWPFNWEYSTALLRGRLCITVEDIGPSISIKLTVSQVEIKHCLLIRDLARVIFDWGDTVLTELDRSACVRVCAHVALCPLMWLDGHPCIFLSFRSCFHQACGWLIVPSRSSISWKQSPGMLGGHPNMHRYMFILALQWSVSNLKWYGSFHPKMKTLSSFQTCMTFSFLNTKGDISWPYLSLQCNSVVIKLFWLNLRFLQKWVH